jgi:hypothetical protein
MIRQLTDIRRFRDAGFANEIMLAACVVALSLSPLAFAGEEPGNGEPAASLHVLKPVHESGLDGVRGLGFDAANAAQLAVILWDESNSKCCARPGPVSGSGVGATQVVSQSNR